MGERIRRPLHEGRGEKPDTPKPSLKHDLIFRAQGGARPTTEKPKGSPTAPLHTPTSDKT
jgi:hypothetical protein